MYYIFLGTWTRTLITNVGLKQILLVVMTEYAVVDCLFYYYNRHFIYQTRNVRLIYI